MNFLSRKAPGENTLVVDISSGSTGAALVRTHPESVPEITARVRTTFFVSGEPTRESLEAAMLPSLRTSLASIAKKMPTLREKGYGNTLSKALITFTSPWLISDLKTVIIEREGGFVFDHKMLSKIVSEEKELFISRLKEDWSEESEVFESVVTSLYQNGYETSKLVKEKLKKAEMSFLLSATTKNLLRKIESELIKTVGIKRGVALHSFMYAYFKVLSHSFQSLHSALLINMTQELTDVLFIRHGSSALNASLPFGPGTIARALSAKLGIPEELSYSYLTLFASGVFDEETTKVIDTALTEVENKWRVMWKNMGESIPEGASVPYSVFLVVPSGFEKLVKTFLQSVLGDREIILLGETNTFTKELVKAETDIMGDEKILVLSSFSNIIK